MAPKRKRMKLDNSTDEKNDSMEEVDNVKPKRKSRSKIQPDTPNVAQPKPKLDFMSLNDDCLRSILEELSVKDLCSISQTCVRLQSLVASVFARCYKEKQVKIKIITGNGESIEYLFNDGAHIKRFGKLDNSAVEEDNLTEEVDDVKSKRKLKSKTQPDTPNEAQPKPNPELMSLNDDCLRSILEKLPVKDLCFISQTCVRFQSLAASVFVRCHRGKHVVIEDIAENGESIEYLLEDEVSYIKCFGKFIQNVTFGKSFQTKRQLNALSKLYEREELPPITTLIIDGWGPRLTKKTFETEQSIMELIKHVESLTIINLKLNDDLNECVLQYMPQLKRLTLSKNLKGCYLKGGWTECKYPKLIYFAWHLDELLPIQLIKTFLALNPNITHFSLATNSQSTLQQLQNEAIRVTELYFTFSKDSTVADCLRELRMLCEGNLCHRVHLKFSNWSIRDHLNDLIPLCPYIEGLYFKHAIFKDKLSEIIQKCDHLKVIQLHVASDLDLDWLLQSKSLEKVFIFTRYTSHKSYNMALFNYIARAPNVKKIYMRLKMPDDPFSHRFDFSRLDAERLKLGGATKLKIYLKTDENTFDGKFYDIECVHESLEVTRIETEHIDNPLVTKYLTTDRHPF